MKSGPTKPAVYDNKSAIFQFEVVEYIPKA